MLFLIGCDSNTEPEELFIDQILFKSDEVRTYDQSTISVRRDAEGNELERTEEREVFMVENKSVSEPVPGIEGTIQVDAYSVELPEFVSSKWYTQSDSQLIEVAYRGGTDATLKDARHHIIDPFLPVEPFHQEATYPDEITVRPDPRVVFEFPLEVGKSWESLRLVEFSLVVTGEVLESENIEVPAGTYHCQVVKTTHTFPSGTTEILHYFTAEGLVKRIMRVDRKDPGDLAGRPDIVERTVVLVEVTE